MERKQKRWLIGFLVLCVLLITAVSAFFICFEVKSIRVTGNKYYNENAIKNEIFTSRFDYNSVLLEWKHKFAEKTQIPFIQEYTIKRIGNQEIEIKVYEKSLVACFGYMNEYVYFDQDGIVLECSSEKLERIPSITGIDFKGFALYEPIQVSDTDIFQKIVDLSQLIQKYELNIERVHFNTRKEVILHLEKITVELGEKEFYDEQIAALSDILTKAEAQNLEGEIDMRNYQPGDRVILRKSK